MNRNRNMKVSPSVRKTSNARSRSRTTLNLTHILTSDHNEGTNAELLQPNGESVSYSTRGPYFPLRRNRYLLVAHVPSGGKIRWDMNLRPVKVLKKRTTNSSTASTVIKTKRSCRSLNLARDGVTAQILQCTFSERRKSVKIPCDISHGEDSGSYVTQDLPVPSRRGQLCAAARIPLNNNSEQRKPSKIRWDKNLRPLRD